MMSMTCHCDIFKKDKKNREGFCSKKHSLCLVLFDNKIIQILLVLDNIINVTILADGSKMLAGTRYLASLDTA